MKEQHYWKYQGHETPLRGRHSWAMSNGHETLRTR